MTINVDNKYFWMIKTSILMLVLLVFLYSSVAVAQESSAGDREVSALEQLVTMLDGNATIQADIEQLIQDQDGRELQETKVRLLMQKPDHFYWAVVSPYEELTVIDGKSIWRYEPDLDQVTIQTFDENLSRLPILLINADAQSLNAAYDVSAVETFESEYQHFVLVALDPASLFESLSLTFLHGQLEEMHIEDSLGQKASLTFSNMVVNSEIDPEIFEFIIPEGIDVIDTRAAEPVME